MALTRRCDYACRILRAAYRAEGAYVSVSDIAEQEDIPYAFARSIQHELVNAGFIVTVRGARGGLALGKDPAEITMLQVLEVVQGSVSLSLCTNEPEVCCFSGECEYNKVWRGADAILREYLSSITMKDLFEQGDKHPSIAAALAHDDRPDVGCNVPSCGSGSCAAAQASLD